MDDELDKRSCTTAAPLVSGILVLLVLVGTLSGVHSIPQASALPQRHNPSRSTRDLQHSDGELTGRRHAARAGILGQRSASTTTAYEEQSKVIRSAAEDPTSMFDMSTP